MVSVVSAVSANPALNPLVRGCLNCLGHFRDSCRFRESDKVANHRFRNA